MALYNPMVDEELFKRLLKENSRLFHHPYSVPRCPLPTGRQRRRHSCCYNGDTLRPLDFAPFLPYSPPPRFLPSFLHSAEPSAFNPPMSKSLLIFHLNLQPKVTVDRITRHFLSVSLFVCPPACLSLCMSVCMRQYNYYIR